MAEGNFEEGDVHQGLTENEGAQKVHFSEEDEARAQYRDRHFSLSVLFKEEASMTDRLVLLKPKNET